MKLGDEWLMVTARVEVIWKQIEAELRRRQPQSTGELHKRLHKSELQMSRGELGRILEAWRGVASKTSQRVRVHVVGGSSCGSSQRTSERVPFSFR